MTRLQQFDAFDKLLSIFGGPNPRTYTYDVQGRTETIDDTSGLTTFAYDYDGRATSITYPNASSDTFGYNGLGARMSSSGVNGSKTFRRAGLGVTSSVLDDGTKKYTPGVSSRENGVSTFQHSGLKNALDQTDSSENVTASRHYDAFGNVISSSGTWQGPFGYAGDFGYQEDGNGLKLLGHRYYDSDTGRFLTNDPIGSGRNWYVYLGGRPVSNADPSGLSGFAVAISGALSAIAKMPYVHWYGTEEEAAIAVLDWLWDKSVEEDYEYGGWIVYRNEIDGGKSYRPVPATKGDNAYQVRMPYPKTGGGSALYHTHPGPGNRRDEVRGSRHSPRDKENANKMDRFFGRPIRSYVLGQTYKIYRYDSRTGLEIKVGNIVRG